MNTLQQASGLKHQAGLSLWGWLPIIALIALVLVTGLKLAPVYMEYFTVKKIMQQLDEDPKLDGAPRNQITDSFRKRLNVSNVSDAVWDSYDIKRGEGQGYKLSVDYQVRKHLYANLDIIAHFQHTQAIGGGG